MWPRHSASQTVSGLVGTCDLSHSKRKTQRSERFGSLLWSQRGEPVERKRGSSSRCARATLGWNDEFGVLCGQGKIVASSSGMF
jgi:hypothetical protein